MSGFFKTILIPVDFTVNTEAAVKQAIELAYSGGAAIHLVHVLKPRSILNKLSHTNKTSARNEKHGGKDAWDKLQGWKHSIEETISNCIVYTSLVKGNVHRNIQEVASEIKPNLIIIGKNRKPGWLRLNTEVCPNWLAKSTGFPVLTVMSKTVSAKIKTIIVSVGSFIPKRKIDLVLEFSKQHRFDIHLVVMQNNIETNAGKNSSFLETYGILNTKFTSRIHHHIVKGNNFPRAILKYADVIGADMIFVNPSTETKTSKLTHKHINDLLEPGSNLKILSVEPYSEQSL